MLAAAAALWRGAPRAAFGVWSAAVVATIVVVYGVVMPQRDPSAADREFLQKIEQLVPKDATLIATGGRESARHYFYVKRSLAGGWNAPVAVARELRRAREVYALGRVQDAPELARLGRVKVVAQSARTRGESRPQNRFALFHISAAR